jgi:hypothetical protein
MPGQLRAEPGDEEQRTKRQDESTAENGSQDEV